MGAPVTDRPVSSPPTLQDVAARAGVSLATASRTLNGSRRKVADQYRERVLAAAAELHYIPNLAAQAVARGFSATITLVVGDIADPYFSSIAAGVARAADEHGLMVTIAQSGRDTARELDFVRTLRGQRPRAIILTGSRREQDANDPALRAELAEYEDGGGRVVVVAQPELPFATIAIDNYGGARALGDALVAQGYRNFAAVVGEPGLMTVRDRLAGFRDALSAHGLQLPDRRVAADEFTRDGGFSAAHELVAVQDWSRVDAVFAASDVMAIGAMSALRECGYRPGPDVGVAGFDDIAPARDVTPALTTVRLDLEGIGEHAVRLALDDGVGEQAPSGRVILRESTPARPRAR